MPKLQNSRAFKRGRSWLVGAALTSAFAALFIASGGCAGAVTPDSPPDVTGGADASTDAPLDAPLDASSDAPPDAPADGSAGYSGPIGDPCATDMDCGAGNRCQLTEPGGYCIKDCGAVVPCPDGTLCSPIPMTRITGACMKACSSKADCRQGYDCAVVYLFPGDPSGPKSPGPVCWAP